MTEINDLWVEKYRPKTQDEYVWLNSGLESCVKNWIKEQQLPHLLLTGSPGTGKTSLALMLFRLLDVHPSDILKINASEDRKLEMIRDRVLGFATMVAVGNIKYVLLDEADMLPALTQSTLRNIMETHAGYCRFIMTANHSSKIIPAIKSRCQHFHFQALDKDQYTKRLVEILADEGASLDESLLDIVDQYVDACWPDLRKGINTMQQNWSNGVLQPLENGSASSSFDEIVKLVKKSKIQEFRKLIGEILTADDYDHFYRYLYENLELWGNDSNSQGEAVLIIADGLKSHAVVSDPEINLSACLIRLNKINS